MWGERDSGGLFELVPICRLSCSCVYNTINCDQMCFYCVLLLSMGMSLSVCPCGCACVCVCVCYGKQAHRPSTVRGDFPRVSEDWPSTLCCPPGSMSPLIQQATAGICRLSLAKHVILPQKGETAQRQHLLGSCHAALQLCSHPSEYAYKHTHIRKHTVTHIHTHGHTLTRDHPSLGMSGRSAGGGGGDVGLTSDTSQWVGPVITLDLAKPTVSFIGIYEPSTRLGVGVHLKTYVLLGWGSPQQNTEASEHASRFQE